MSVKLPKPSSESLSSIAKQLKEQSEAVRKVMAATFRIPQPTFSLPRLEIPRFPSQKEIHEYESAGALLRRLATRIGLWRRSLPKDAQPVILAILSNGTAVDVYEFAAEGHHGIIIGGTIGDSECLFLTHQMNLQLLCYVKQEVEEKKRRKIGFVIGDERLEE